MSVADAPLTEKAPASDRKKFGVIAAFSVAHEVPAALGTIMVPTIFVTEFDMPVEYLGLFALPLVISAFKWAWAPYVDRTGSDRFGRRLSWIFPSASIVSILYVMMALITPSMDTLFAIVALFALIKLFFSTYEIAADAYVVENLRDDEKGSGSGAVWFGKEAGQVIGLAGLLFIADVYGWSAAFLAAAGLFASLNLIALARKEQPVRARRVDHRATVMAYLKQPVNRRILLLTFAFAFAVQIPSAIIGPFLRAKGLTLSEVGATIGIAASLGAGISLAIAAVTIRRIGIKRMAIVTAVLGVLALPPFLWLAQSDAPTLAVVLAIIFWGALMTAPIRMTFYAARLQWTGPDQAGTDFTLQQCAWFLGFGATLAVSGFVAGQVGWTAVFILNGILVTLVVITFVLAHDRFSEQTSQLHRPPAPDVPERL
ncbi:MAG: MFS transporter [Pseudomonadota bacterium]